MKAVNGETKSNSPRRCRMALRFGSRNKRLCTLLNLVVNQAIRMIGKFCSKKYAVIMPPTAPSSQFGRCM